MKKYTNLILATTLLLIIIALILLKEYVYDPSQTPINTTVPTIENIENEIIISGSVYPSKEVEVKSSISGILEKLDIEIGQKINAGDNIAKVKLVPNPAEIETNRNSLNLKKIELENMEKEYQRNFYLLEKKIISRSDFESIEKQYYQAREQYNSAQNQMKLLLGNSTNSGDISNIIKSPISGVVIDLPLEEGSSVIERNNFNVGSSIAVVAQMDYFIFKGKVNEFDLVKFKPNMPLSITLNTLPDFKINATIEKIYPKGIEENGIIKYIVIAKFKIDNSLINIYPGYSATAVFLAENKENVLCIQEKNIYFSNDSAFVDIVDNNKITQRHIETGISDGIKIEVLKGLISSDKIRILE
jgi:HlyD family secretion protein